ncbi:MAG TPA: 3-phosphoglycerate dehydrogenase [Acidiferrobacteraceae bacterium]|nr:3-phosphoglycerate dehydrogenase [Acidiferrobacteraceae bacterium]
MFKILTLNNISKTGLEQFPSAHYEVGGDIADPDAIILRSYKMHDMAIPESVKAIGRAGAGVNNIPVDAMSQKGVPVFNAPGANSNAVKELVVTGMLLACRNICQAWDFARQLAGDDATIAGSVESGKKMFAGTELPGRTIGVVGLGAIGRSVANICLHLGMNVVGYDPMLTVEGAWQLSSRVERARNLEQLLAKVDFITFHVPLNDKTRNMIDVKALGMMRDGVTVMNFARDGIVDDAAVCAAIDAGKIHAYVSDFPHKGIIGHKGVIALPHLGASTEEAETNCAVMVSSQVKDFLENGNIRNSVNFPEMSMPRSTKYRLLVVNANVPNMLGQISTAMADASLNIHDMINQSKGDIAYTLVDTDSPIPSAVADKISAIDGVSTARTV